jgi:multimeric flavodoxin WrbA
MGGIGMKVVGINGSARVDGNTAILIRKVFDVLQKQGIETELVQLGGKAVRGCRACYACFQNKNNQCFFKDDPVNECITKMIAADGIIFGSPVYFSDVSAEMKALLDRTGFVSVANGGLLKHKAGAAVVAVRRGGATHAFDTLNHLMHISNMFLVGASYWNMAYGLEIGAVEKDEEGMANMQILGENMAYLLHKLKG